MPRYYEEPIGKPKKRGAPAPYAQGMLFSPEDVKQQRRLKTVTWCMVGSKLDDFRRYFSLGQEGLHWYDHTPKVILELFGGDVDRTELYIYLLAATSPTMGVRQNSRIALKTLKMFDRYGVDEQVFRKAFKFDAHFFNVMRALRKEMIQGRKVTSFAKNLLGPSYFPDAADAVTVDRWMMRIARGLCTEILTKEEDAPSAPEYRCVERAVRKLAAEVGVEPRQYQAAAWVGIKKTCGDPADTENPFEIELRRLLDTRQSEFDFDAPMEPVDMDNDPFADFVPGSLEGEVMGYNPELSPDELTARILDPGEFDEYVIPT
jgi:hypothetical protein